MTSDMVGLKEIADELRAMREQFLRMGEGADTVLTYIQYADLHQCKTIVDALAERVSTLLGVATELEDASCALQFEIEHSEMTDDELEAVYNAAIDGEGKTVLDGLRAVAEEERAACARICNNFTVDADGKNDDARRCVRAIRRRQW